MAFETILVGADFSDTGRAALDWAIDLARPLGSRILVAHVYDLPIVGFPDASFIVDPTTAAHMSDDAQKGLDREIARVHDRGVPVEGSLHQGDARDVLPSLAVSSGAWLLVVGSHGRRGVARALLGSVAENIVRASSVPVAVVHAKAH
ncbi:MAG: universal stress protein [Polyangiaceae bacterium]|jgi:nucleotide-binding universal stress UspA family protein